VYRTRIDYGSNPLVEVVNELAATAVHVEATDCLSNSSILVELVDPDIGIAQKGFRPTVGTSFVAAATPANSGSTAMTLRHFFIKSS
jgi:hypothetical protein